MTRTQEDSGREPDEAEAALHAPHMRLALREAVAARDAGEVPTGCVIVGCAEADGARGRVLGRAHNQVELLKDPTAHAEMIAITQAAAARGDWRLTDTALYVTKEPCAMCAGAIVLARIPLVVFGAVDPKRGGVVSAFRILSHPDLNHRCRVVHGVLEAECAGLLREFFRQRRRGAPAGEAAAPPAAGLPRPVDPHAPGPGGGGGDA